MSEQFSVGQRVRLTENIYEPADEYAPGGYLAKKGEVVNIKAINPGRLYPISVFHDWVTDGKSFGVSESEIEPASPASDKDGEKT